MTEEDIQEWVNQIQAENTQTKEENARLKTMVSASSFQQAEANNMVQFQLDPSEILTRIEHFLKGDYVVTDDEGNQYYKTPKNHDKRLLNDYGVNTIMQILSNYLDKTTFLSFYQEMRINEILADLGEKLTIFIFCNYERMGMTTEFKKSRYDMIVLNILHIIESAYRRALMGKGAEQINTHNFNMNNMNPQPMFNPLGQQKRRTLNPFTWFS